MSGAAWAAAAEAAMQIGTAWLNSDSQRLSNRTNVRLQREQQRWEENMANTAVQRRVQDITKAGGNPAAAFVSGGEAATPVIAPARVEPTRIEAPRIDTAKLLAQAQIDNIRANTINTSADTRNKTIAGDVAQSMADQGTKWDVLNKEATNRKIEAEIKNITAQESFTAAQQAKIDKMIDALAQTASNQAREGKINVEALENVAKMGGVLEAKQMGPVIKLLIDAIVQYMRK